MRRQLALVSLAVTSLVVIAFTVPLGLLVQRQAEGRAQVEAERRAQTTQAVVALALADAAQPPAAGELVAEVGGLPPGVGLVLPDGTTAGEAGADSEVVERARQGETSSRFTAEGWEVALPVITSWGPVVVRAVAPWEELRRGVAEAWTLLGLLGVAMIGGAVLVADRLGSTLTRPVSQLAEAARRLGSGDLETRVSPEGPPELREVAHRFNWLAERLDALLAAERERVADISHRLRTPLTALRLQAEGLSDAAAGQALMAHIDRLHAEIDQVITSVRRGGGRREVGCDLAEVVRHRAAFWAVLAEEQSREVEVVVAEEPLEVAVAAEDLAAVVDALIENVFAHTPSGTPFRVEATREGGRVVLRVEDRGPGFPAGADPVARGSSPGGSTGLGLDIARRLAQRSGGGLHVDDRPGGGAVIELRFG